MVVLTLSIINQNTWGWKEEKEEEDMDDGRYKKKSRGTFLTPMKLKTGYNSNINILLITFSF